MDLATYDESIGRQAAATPGDTGWAETLVSPRETTDVMELVRRAASGLGLAALYGLALGARQGGHALIQHALGVPLALLVVGAVAAPSMFVFLSMFRAEVDAWTLAGATARGIASAGLLLAGLAPAAALFVVSSETPTAASLAVLFGLVMSGGVALARTIWDIVRSALAGETLTAFGAACISLGFGAFSVALAVRIWWAVLPVLGGAS